MPRVPALLTAGVLALVTATGGAAASSNLTLVAGTAAADDAAVNVLDAPAELELRQVGVVTVKAAPPAAPGDPVFLNTAGTYNAGYNRVSESVLGQDLTATLRVEGRKFLGSYDYWATLPANGTHPEVSTARFAIRIVSPAPQRNPSCGGQAPVKADGSRWVCTYDDEFNGPELDRRYWIPQETETSGFVTGTRTQYACAVDSPQTIDVQDGRLLLSLVNLGERRSCGKNLASQYAFGQVMHHQTYSQTYGKYEVRARIPDLRVPGAQQSFWLWPETDTYGPWPASGEIDFAEMYSNTPGLDRPYLHYLPGTTTRGTNDNVTHAECPIRVGDYNTYGVEWQPGRITILLNGKVCMINDYSSVVAGDGSSAPFDHPFYLALNQAMGALGNQYDPTQVPARLTTEVDWVRVWR